MERSRAELIRVLRGAVLQAFPILRRRILPAKGRVVAVYSSGGRAGEPRVYSVDVQPLDPAGKPVGSVLPHLTVPTIWVGPGRGILAVPPVGAIVRVGWYESGEPYLDAVLPDGYDLVPQAAGTLTIIHPSARIEIDADGRILICSTQEIRLAGDVMVEGDLVVTGSINP